MARDLASAERHGYPFICGMWYCTAHFSSRDSVINIDVLSDYHMNESADVEEVEFFSNSGEES